MGKQTHHSGEPGITPPVICDSGDAGRIKARDFIHGLQPLKINEMAAAEAKRLAPYFTFLAARLALSDTARQHALAYKGFHKTPDADDLARLFCMITEKGRSLLLSTPMVMPTSILHDSDLKPGQRGKWKTDFTTFFKTASYRDRPMRFGFYQAVNTYTEDDNLQGAISIPSFQFSYSMPTMPRTARMLTALQNIITAVNHDVMHHFTSSILNKDISKTNPVPYSDNLRDHHKLYFHGTSSEDLQSYESWNILSHAATMKSLLAAGEAGALQEHLDIYYKELSWYYFDRSVRLSPHQQQEAYDILAIAPAFALMRIIPMDHPLMQYCLACIEKYDRYPDFIYTRELSCHDPAQLEPAIHTWNAEQRLQAIAALSDEKSEKINNLLTHVETHIVPRNFSTGMKAAKEKSALSTLVPEFRNNAALARDIQTCVKSNASSVPPAILPLQQNVLHHLWALEDFDPQIDRIINRYKNAGLDLSTLSYRNLKIRQLIRCAPEIAELLGPAPGNSETAMVRRRAADFDAILFSILARP